VHKPAPTLDHIRPRLNGRRRQNLQQPLSDLKLFGRHRLGHPRGPDRTRTNALRRAFLDLRFCMLTTRTIKNEYLRNPFDVGDSADKIHALLAMAQGRSNGQNPRGREPQATGERCSPAEPPTKGETGEGEIVLEPKDHDPFAGFVDIAKRAQNFARQFIEGFDELMRRLDVARSKQTKCQTGMPQYTGSLSIELPKIH
jgi:hypothetical protein